MYFPCIITLLIVIVKIDKSNGEVGEVNLDEVSEKQYSVKINKCCEENEIMVDTGCQLLDKYNQSAWVPQFKTEEGKDTQLMYFRYVIGYPDCETIQWRPIFDLGKSEDELNLLIDGRLKHLIHHEYSSGDIKDDSVISNTFSIHEPITIPEVKEPLSYVHGQNKYCMDKILITSTNATGQYAVVCVPKVEINWKNTSLWLE